MAISNQKVESFCHCWTVPHVLKVMNIYFLLDVQYILVPGRNLESGLKKFGVLSFVRELDGNDENQCDQYLKDVSMYARGKRTQSHVISFSDIFRIEANKEILYSSLLYAFLRSHFYFLDTLG